MTLSDYLRGSGTTQRDFAARLGLSPNRAVGGAPQSKHMAGTAFDVAMANHDPVAFEAAARKAGFLGFGFYPRSGFLHVDTGPAREWGERFPPRPVPFAVETPPARETLVDSRTLKCGGIAGVATLGGAGVEIAQEGLAEMQGALMPLIGACRSNGVNPEACVAATLRKILDQHMQRDAADLRPRNFRG